MGVLFDQLKLDVRKFFATMWKIESTESAPEPEELRLLDNHGKRLEGVVLYADMAESTLLVDTLKDERAAEIYEAYLHSAGKIIRQMDGEIVSYDGDRIMAIFTNGAKNTNAAIAALKIYGAVEKIINPIQKEIYPHSGYTLRHVVGIDRSDILAVRVGVRGDNDITWVGRAPNYAAKICQYGDAVFPSVITEDVYNIILDEARLSKDGQEMWEYHTTFKGIKLYRSSWYRYNF